jgi:hypothetical protein
MTLIYFSFYFSICFVIVLSLLLLCIHAESIIGYWLLSSARKKIKNSIIIITIFYLLGIYFIFTSDYFVFFSLNSNWSQNLFRG